MWQTLLRGFFILPIHNITRLSLSGFILAARIRNLQAIRANPYCVATQGCCIYTYEKLAGYFRSISIKQKGRIKMKKPEMPCAMHDEHLCYLVNMGYIENSLNDYKELVKDAKFVCKKCGRSANSNENLCRPVKI